MRWTPLLPSVSLLLAVSAAMMLSRPVLDVLPFVVAESDVRWIIAAEDLWPRRPVEGEEIKTLRTPEAVSGRQARQYTIGFDEPAPGGAAHSVMIPITGAETRVLINGVALESKAVLPHSKALITEIPPSGFQRGHNRVHVIVPKAAPYEWPRAIFLGPFDVLQKASLRFALTQYWALFSIVGLGLASSVLGFFSAFVARERLHLAFPSLVSLMLSGFAALTFYDWPGAEVFLAPWLKMVFATAASILLLLMIASEAEPWPRAITILFRCAVAGFAALGAALLFSFWNRESALVVSHWAGTGTILLSSSGALWLALASSAAAWSPMQRSIAALVAFALMMAAISDVDRLGGVAYLAGKAMFGVAAGLGLAAWFVWIAVRVFRDVESALQKRLGLGRIIREQQAQLKTQQEALEREIIQRTVLEERERFSRDIHDGVGGSLVSLLVQARTGALNEQDLEAGLQRTLADLRLMIDALDHSQATLAAAFSTFQTRIAPLFAAAGVELNWRQDALETRALKDPSSLLHVFRILQEACTNTIKHAAATRASITINWNDETNSLEIEVEDNGAADATDAKTGHGLKNMSERAAKIGGVFTAGPIEQGSGWRVRLHVPGR